MTIEEQDSDMLSHYCEHWSSEIYMHWREITTNLLYGLPIKKELEKIDLLQDSINEVTTVLWRRVANESKGNVT